MVGLCTVSILPALILLLAQVFPPVYSQTSYVSQSSDCRTPRGVSGNCVDLNRCQALIQILRQRTPESFDYLKQSQCGFQGRDPMVCCPGANAPLTDNSNRQPAATWDLSSNPLLPVECGEDLSQRILGGEQTDIFEFPWMALLEYTKPNGRTTACGGVLISKRYVLTAAHCVKGKDLPRSWNLVNVRLGEWDTSTARDCLPDGDGGEYCSDEPVTVGIEEQITHEDYRPQSRDQANDIALLRLSRNVAFTSYVRPICLPRNPSNTDTSYSLAGWGKTEQRSESNIKLKLQVPLADAAQCSSVYQRQSITLGDSQICAGGQKGRDSCRGDSGGPLMALQRSSTNRQRWTAFGIVSFGPSPCGMENFPGVYTKVTSFVPWILSKIRD